MMAAVSTYLIELYFACFLLSFKVDVHGELLRVTTGQLQRHLETGFSKRRSYLQEAQKNSTRKYIKDFLDTLADKYTTDVIEQDYTFVDEQLSTGGVCFNSSCPGANYLWILPGSRYGTPQDEVHLLGSHYDSREDTPGVDDNGSGMAAMLETARILSQSELGCERLNSVAFAAFDWEELGSLYGSRMFLNQIEQMTDGLQISEGNFAGAIILDTIMNWNNTENSQTLPAGYDQIFPELYAEIQQDGFRGTFLNIVQRTDDAGIANGLGAIWSNLTDSKYRNIISPLPLSGKVSTWPQDMFNAFRDFLRSDHANFWNYNTTDNKGLKAVFLTDSANFRGVMRDCYHNPCDNLAHVTPEGLEFLAKTTETLVRYYLQQSTEKTATECGGEPQENWKEVTSASACLGSSIVMLAIATILHWANWALFSSPRSQV